MKFNVLYLRRTSYTHIHNIPTSSLDSSSETTGAQSPPFRAVQLHIYIRNAPTCGMHFLHRQDAKVPFHLAHACTQPLSISPANSDLLELGVLLSWRGSQANQPVLCALRNNLHVFQPEEIRQRTTLR